VRRQTIPALGVGPALAPFEKAKNKQDEQAGPD
jgi:hypothetical protein